MTLRVLAWPLVSNNPYIADLYRRIAEIDPDIEIEAFSPMRGWSDKADVVHVHWPDAAANPPSLVKALAKTAAVLAGLESLTRRGAKLVWTCHNLTSHDVPHPGLNHVLHQRFNRMVDGVIHLTEASRSDLADHPVLGSKPSVVVPHGHFRGLSASPPSKADARSELGLDPDVPTLGFVGMIRPYKNVPELIRAFAGISEPAQLVIGGRPLDETVAGEVSRAAEEVDGVRLDLRWLTDDEVVLRARAADVIVLPYQEVHNSGVAVLALGLDRPVAVNPSGSMATLGPSVGADWVHHLHQPLDSAQLDEVIRWAARPRSGSPDMSAFDPDRAAELTVAFYRRLVA